MYPLAILAGGLATRLHPLTQQIPKALMDIDGEPFIAYQLRLLASRGIGDVVICAGYLGEMLSAYVGSGDRFGLRVRYSFDGDRLLGTGWAILKALPLLGQRFFVTYGDSYLPCDFAAVQSYFTAGGYSSLMTVYRNRNLWDVSNVAFSDGQIRVYDKHRRSLEMEYIDYGLGLFDSTVFNEYLPDVAFDLAQVYQAQLALGKLAGYEVHERFYEIGSFSGLDELRMFLSDQKKNK